MRTSVNEPSTEPPKFICLLVTFDSQKAEVSYFDPVIPWSSYHWDKISKFWKILALMRLLSAKRSQSTVNVHQTEYKYESKLRLLSSKSACPIKIHTPPTPTPKTQIEKSKSQVSLAEFRLLHRQVILRLSLGVHRYRRFKKCHTSFVVRHPTYHFLVSAVQPFTKKFTPG